jgi:AAA domain
VVDESAVDLALLEMAANKTALDAGQASLVRQMCSSGARLQLAIAPAGAGKTTAKRALTLAWTQDGGQLLGLAPSAAAALSLDAAVQFAIDRGASVRLIGDDQQLAAIGAGGVLRDIKQTHGALHLAELLGFINPAEAPASLGLREGKPEALKFYLDHSRVHVGDIATTVEEAFSAWVSDRAAGLDAIMLAPTWRLVAELDHSPAGSEVSLADGNRPAPRPAGRRRARPSSPLPPRIHH